ncbi:MAG: error-prone DNA polymerase [Planctomycetaceae bacterium]|nr:error-prone DNA polymerase [Planctomycetaceae bacterium]
MPEAPYLPKRQPLVVEGRAAPPGGPAYAELHCYTNFSFLEGASHADELVAAAAELGYRALAVTDRNTLAGVVRAHVAAKEAGLKLLVGAEITPVDAPPVVLWAADRAGYGRLSRLITVGRRRAAKGACELTLADVAEHAAGLVAGVLPYAGVAGDAAQRSPQGQRTGGSLRSSPATLSQGASLDSGTAASLRVFEGGDANGAAHPPPLAPPRRGEGDNHDGCAIELAETQRALAAYREAFPGRCYLLGELHYGVDDADKLQRLAALSRQARVPLVAAGDVHYHAAARMPLQQVLTAIRHGTTVAGLGARLMANAERHLRTLEQIETVFAAAPAAIARTMEIADRCQFSLDQLRYEYPEELAPPGETPMQYLARLAWEGARRRYGAVLPDKVRDSLAHELALIEELRYEAFFLTVYDVVRFARSREILCQGRGSAANSAVCFCLGITEVDPVRHDLLFERFVSRERHEAPDIDVDFEHERREEVLQYVYQRYGRERAGLAATVITYRARSAIRDVGKALGLSLDRVDALAKNFDARSERTLGDERCVQSGVDPQSRTGRQLVALVNELIGFPRHLSQHVGGMVITQGPLCELVPIENASMDGRTVIQWDKDDLEDLGMLKVDCLALGMLTAIRRAFGLIRRATGRQYALANVPHEDPSVYGMIQRADTIGVFQIESRAQMSMLPRLKPRCFYDLVVEVAIVRPGPIQGNMVHPYLRRRRGLEPVSYPSEEVRQVLCRTLGVPLFQEQAMQLAMVAAGFTADEADQLRRAMGAWRKTGVIDKFRVKLLAGMRAKGYPEEFALRLFEQIRGFGEYGFPESHAASFAKLVYVSAYLKHYYPAAFAAALVNSQPMGFYAPGQLVRDAREHGVEVRGVDVNASDWDCSLEVERGERSEVGDQKAATVGRGMGAELRATAGLPSSANPASGAHCWTSQQWHKQSSQQGHTAGWLGTSEASPQDAATGGSAALRPQAPAAPVPEPGGPSPQGGATGGSAALRPQPLVALRLGLRMLRGLAEDAGRRIEQERIARGPFRSIGDFTTRTGLGQAVVKLLADADAFASLAVDRRAALWQALAQPRTAESLPLFDDLPADDELAPPLPELSPQQQVFADYLTAGLTLREHPLAFYREELTALGVKPTAALATHEHGRPVKVAGLVLMRQRPGTAKGITFMTLEDETGVANIVVHPGVWKRFELPARRAKALVVRGRLERKDRVIHVVVNRIDDMEVELADLRHKSRDFH